MKTNFNQDTFVRFYGDEGRVKTGLSGMRGLALGMFVIGLAVICLFLLSGCGGGATPAPQPTTVPPARVETVEPTADSAQAANALATSMAVIQNPPTVEPKGEITPSPAVAVGRTFRFGSLNGTLVSWQIVPGDGKTCPTVTPKNVAVQLRLENTAAKEFSLRTETVKIFGPDDVPADTIYQGSVGMGDGGAATVFDVPGGKTVDTVLCTGIRKEDADQMTLVLGDKELLQTRVPLSASGTKDLGGYATVPFTKSFTFKGSTITVSQVILTIGIWSDQGGQGQAAAGKQWLLLPTQVDNASNPNLFIEKGEITLDADGQTLQPALDFNSMYQAAPYGLAKGQQATGAILFEIPQDTKQATLHLKSGDSTYADDVSVLLTLPAVH